MSDSTESERSSVDERQNRAGYHRRYRRKRSRREGFSGKNSDSSPSEADLSDVQDNNPQDNESADSPNSLSADDNDHAELDVQSEQEENQGEEDAFNVRIPGNNMDIPGINDDVQQNRNDLEAVDIIQDVSSASENDGASTASENSHESDNSAESEESEDSDDENGDDEFLFPGSPVTFHEFMLAILTLSTAFKLTGQCVGAILSLISMICPPDNKCVKSLDKFKKYFSMIGRTVIKFHYYCSSCEFPLDDVGAVCGRCDAGEKVNHFLELPILSQLQSMFLRPGFYDALQFRFGRVKKSQHNWEDIYDGEIYKEQSANGFLNNPNNISFMWYSDGVSIYKSTNFSIWPMFLVINELNYKMRVQRENIILAGIWFGCTKPNPNIFLRPLHNDLQIFKQDGHIFQRFGADPVHVKAKMLIAICDLQAKCRFMRMKQWNGYYGCSGCTIRGERFDIGPNQSVHVYPYSPLVTPRDNNDIPVFARLAVQARERDRDESAAVYGVKGPTLLYYMLPNLIKCMGLDAMHGLFLGLMKLITSLWFDAKYVAMPFSVNNLLDVVDDRLKQLRPPNYIQKMPRSIKTKLAFWKAFEYKLWFFYYSLIVMLGVLPEAYWHHHCKIVSAVAILHKESISPEQVDVAEQLIHSYLSDFQQLYGLRFMGINVHQIIHLIPVVKNLGPLWVYSCFFFEDLNGKIAQLVHCSTHAAMQICSSVKAFLSLPVWLNELPPNSVVGGYCEGLLLRSHNRLKIGFEINPRLQVVGLFATCNPIPNSVRNALENAGIRGDGRCEYFYRLKKSGLLYCAQNYSREGQKLSCYAVIKDERNVPLLCKIRNFVKWTPCNQRCARRCDNCPAEFFCIAEIYERVPWDIHYVAAVRMSYLNRVRPTGIISAYPLESIDTSCFYMNVDLNEYIALPVNVIETE